MHSWLMVDLISVEQWKGWW